MTGGPPPDGHSTGADHAGASLLAAATTIVRDAAARDPWLPALRVTGIGWATVELERAARQLSDAFARAGLAEPRWSPGPRDELLGASTWISREWREPPADEPTVIVLLEPDTEGRLAATLVRFAEGVGAVYLARRPDGPAIDAGRLGRPADGPLGSGRLVLARPSWGPNVVVLDR